MSDQDVGLSFFEHIFAVFKLHGQLKATSASGQQLPVLDKCSLKCRHHSSLFICNPNMSGILILSQLTTIQFCIAHLNSIPHHLMSQTKFKTIIFHIYGSMMTFHYGRKSEKNYKASKRANFNSDIPGEW